MCWEGLVVIKPSSCFNIPLILCSTMSLIGYKTIKNNNKSTKGVNLAIQGKLTFVKEAARFAPIPYLKQAAWTTLKIVDTIQSVKDNKTHFQLLADDVTEIIAGIWKSCQKVPADEKLYYELRSIIGELDLMLESILEFVKEQVTRNRAVRVLNSSSDVVKITGYRGRLEAAMNQFEEANKRSRLNTTYAPSQPEVEVDIVEAKRLFESMNSVYAREEKERAHEVEPRRRLAEEEETRIEEQRRLLQEIEDPLFVEGQARELQRLQEVERARIDEQAKEQQRLRDLEKAQLAEEERESKRLRELEKDRLDQARIAAEQALEQLRLAFLKAEEKEKESKRVQKEIAANEKEDQRRRQDEDRARVEAEQQLRRREEEEEIRIAPGEDIPRMLEERKPRFEEQNRKQKSDRPAEEKRRREVEANKMKARVQEEEDDRTLVDEPESEGSVSEKESDGEAPLKAAPPAEQARRSSDKRKKRKANSAPAAPSVESAFAKMHMGPTPTHSLPPMPPGSPFHTHQDFSPYGTTLPYGSPYFPPLMPMAMYPGYNGQTLYGLPPSPPPNGNVNSFNNSTIGTLSISNTNSYPMGKAAII